MSTDARAQLLRATDALGGVFGSENISLFLYSLIKLHRAETIVELGGGLGISSLWMALACKENGAGRVWTVENGELLRKKGDDQGSLLERAARAFASADLPHVDPSSVEGYFASLAAAFGVGAHLELVARTISLEEAAHFDSYPFAAKPLDLVFSDFMHGPQDVLRILCDFLPRMAPASSLFIDSAPALWPSYLLLENVVGHLNAGRVPQVFLDWGCDLGDFVRTRVIRLIHLTEPHKEVQNATAWLKIEPIDVFPYPRTHMSE